jgi:hypothetical protein
VGVERGQRVTQPAVYILVYLDMAVGGEVVGVGKPCQPHVHLSIAGRDAFHTERAGRAGVALRGAVFRLCGLLDPHGRLRPGILAPVLLRIVPAVPVRLIRVRVAHAQTLPRSAGVPSITMATTEECRSALEKLSDNLAHADGEVRTAASLNRSLSCHITDLDITFTGRLADGRIEVADTFEGPPPEKAQIRLAMTGDDLVAMVEGQLNFARAWASSRVRLEASFRDLLSLRSLL